MFRNFFRKLSRKSITLSRTDIALIGGAAGLVALIHFGGGNGVHYTTAEDKMPFDPPPKPAASTCLVNTAGEYANRCNEPIKVVNCLPIDTKASISSDARICYQLSLKPKESFVAAAIDGERAEVGACYTYQIPFTRIDREGFVCR